MPQAHDNMVIMIRSAGAEFPPVYSDSSLMVQTRCVKKVWLSGNCRASPVVSVRSKTQLTRLIQSSLHQPHSSGSMSCFFYTCHCHCQWSSFHTIQLIILHFPLTLDTLRMSVLNSSYDSFIDIICFRTVKF